jgi:hypothetical protein
VLALAYVLLSACATEQSMVRAEPTDAFPTTWSGQTGQTLAAHAPSAQPITVPPAPVAPPEPAAAPAPVAATHAPPPVAIAEETFFAAPPQPTAYALVVGIERYRDVPSPTGARHDAETFVRLARATLGVPERNVRVAFDDRATKVDIEKHLAWLKANVPAGGRIYFYFSGHGAPDPSTGSSYILPYDGDPSALEATGLLLSSVLLRLSETSSHDVLAIVDSCFSGAGGRSVLAPGARPLVVVKAPEVPPRVALVAAAAGEEISGPNEKANSGLFTTYFVDALGSGKADIDGDGQISLEELQSWVRPRVAREASRQNRKQTPSLALGRGIDKSTFWVAPAGAP